MVPSPPILKLQGHLWVLAGGRFESPLREAIHRLKYSGQPEVAEGLTLWWLERLNRFLDTPEVVRGAAIPCENNSATLDLIPVPLHATRLVERGYNQSALLASQVSPWLGARVSHRLERDKQTRAQAGLRKLERAENIQGAFRASRSRRPRPAILIDDVATTGATLGSAAAALRSQNIECLGALVLAASRD